MNRHNTLALLMYAVLPGTEALRWKAKKVPMSDVRRAVALSYLTYDATHNDVTAMTYYYSDETRPRTQKRAPPASLQRLDQAVHSFKKLKVFAADCLKSVDSNFYSPTRARWYWTSLDEAKHAVQLQEELDARTLAKIPAEKQDSEGKFKLVSKHLESSKNCNLLKRANMQAKLFVVTGESLEAIIKDKDLGSQVIKRWDGDTRGDHYWYCSWANVLRLAFGVSCGRDMYEKIWVQCDKEIKLDADCSNDWNLDDGAAKLENIPVGVNNEYMPYAVHVLQKAKGAAGMLIQYENRDPQVAIWDMKQIKLTEREIIQEQADQN